MPAGEAAGRTPASGSRVVAAAGAPGRSTTDPAAQRADATDAMRGDLAQCALPELLQFLQSLRKDGQLVIQRDAPRQTATIGMIEGRVVDACCPPLHGEACFQFLLSWTRGRFLFLNGATSPQTSISADLRTLLLEGMRLLDELSPMLSALPPVEAVLHRQRAAELAESAELTRLEWRLLERSDGLATVGDLLGMSLERQGAVAHALTRLIAYGLVGTTPDEGFLGEIVLRARPLSGDHPDPALARVMAVLDGRRSLAEIAAAEALGAHELLVYVQELMDAQLVEVVSGAEPLRHAICTELGQP